jgi:homoserine kinase type II
MWREVLIGPRPWSAGAMSDLGAPTVAMLWEAASPHDVLRDRFGFDGAERASGWITEAARSIWGIETSTCTRIVLSDTNALAWLSTPSGSLVAKWSIAPEKYARLSALAHVLSTLARDGIPVSAPIAALDGRLQVEVDGVSLALQREVPGEILDVDDSAQVHAAGAMLGQLHHALAATSASGPVPSPRETVPHLRNRIAAWLEEDHAHLPPRAIETLRAALPARESDQPVQLLHGDFRSTNILWSKGQVAAVLDFDEARVGDRADEVARSAVLLGTKFTEWDPVTPAVRDAFLRGYASANPLSGADLRWVRALVLWYTLAMVPPADTISSWMRAAEEELSSPHWSA